MQPIMANHRFHNRQGRRVAPACCPNDLMEIRPGRTLYIRRVNPKERDEQFEKEMHVYMQYRETGLLTGPLLGNRRRKNSSKNLPKQEDTTRPEEIKHHSDRLRGGSDAEISGEFTVVSDQLPSQSSAALFPSPSRESMPSRTQSIQSAGGVHVSLARPVSDYQPMNEIAESELKDKEDESDLQSEPKSASTGKKTKGHRPVSAKSIKKAKSIASNDVSDNLKSVLDADIEHDLSLHQKSSFQDVTLFFIHGVGGSSDVWNKQIEFFGNLGFEVIAPDLIGHGFSASPKTARSYHFNEILADLEAIFDKFCKKQNVIVGHSYGCAFAAALGRRRTRRVSKLILISGGAPIPLAPQPGVFMLPVCMLSCIKPCLFSKFERNAFHNIKDSGLSKDIAFDVPVYVLSNMMNGQDWMDGDELYHQWLTMPTLLLHGKYDKFVSLQEEQAMEKAIYYSKLVVIDNSSHMLMMEVPRQVNQMTYNFIFSEQSLEPDKSVSQSEVPSPARSARAKSAKSYKQLA